MHREVGVALAVAHLGIARPPKVTAPSSVAWVLPRGSGRSDLASSVSSVGADAQLAALGAEQPARHPDVIVEVEVLEQPVALAQLVPPEVDLDLGRSVLEIAGTWSCPASGATRSGRRATTTGPCSPISSR